MKDPKSITMKRHTRDIVFKIRYKNLDGSLGSKLVLAKNHKSFKNSTDSKILSVKKLSQEELFGIGGSSKLTKELLGIK